MKVVSNKDNDGKLVYSSEIVKGVVECALDETEGLVKYDSSVKSRQKQIKNFIRVDYVDDYLYIDVFVKIRHDVSIPETASKAQLAIKNSLETMTEFKVKDVNVHVVDVDLEENSN